MLHLGNDNASAGWNPVPVKTTIEFRGMQATYTFPVGEFSARDYL
jgi:hypothetical protein